MTEPAPVSEDELRRQRRRWGCVRNLALVALVLTVVVTAIALAAGGDDTNTATVPLSDEPFEVSLDRLDDEPVAVVKNGGQVQVLRMAGPAGGRVGYCDAAEVFVAPDSGAVYDIDGIRVGSTDAGLDRFDFIFEDDRLVVDLDALTTGEGAGLVASVSLADPDVQACVGAPDDLRFAPAAA